VKRCERCWRLPEVCLCCPDCGSMGECECGKPVPADRDAAQGREVPEWCRGVISKAYRELYHEAGMELDEEQWWQRELLAAYAAGQRSASEAQPAAAVDVDGLCSYLAAHGASEHLQKVVRVFFASPPPTEPPQEAQDEG
jgi:hypothetical protein